MLKKLLRYDFKSIFKFWWIAAATTFVLSLVSAGCITFLKSPRNIPTLVNVSAVFMIMITVFSLVIFSVLTTVLIFVRFYRNFFTDEGYLTFTLPVSIGKLLNSKLIVAVVSAAATGIVITLDVFAMVGIGFADKIFTKEVGEAISFFFRQLIEETGTILIFYIILYFVEAIAIILLSSLFAFLFLYSCITLAAVVTRKARIITAVGIYYGVNMVISFVMQLLTMFGLAGISDRIAGIDEGMIPPTVALILLGVIALLTAVCIALYTLQYWMLDRKLNLS